jgi:hypothetical protein
MSSSVVFVHEHVEINSDVHNLAINTHYLVDFERQKSTLTV